MVEKAATPETKATTKRKRVRSPNYPGLGLQKALDLAKALRSAEGKNAAPVNAVLGHLGYKPKSGAGMVAIAAMKKFGLVSYMGLGERRTVQVTDLANRIILDEREDPTERERLIKQAAVTPAIHRELWAKYSGNLPSDQTLSFWLRTEKSFTDSAAQEFIPQFRATIAFAKLTVADRIADGGAREDDDEADEDSLLEPQREPDTRQLPPPAKLPAGRAIVWQQTQNLSSGLVAEVRLIGDAGRGVRASDLERLQRHLELGIEALREEETTSDASEQPAS